MNLLFGVFGKIGNLLSGVSIIKITKTFKIINQLILIEKEDHNRKIGTIGQSKQFYHSLNNNLIFKVKKILKGNKRF